MGNIDKIRQYIIGIISIIILILLIGWAKDKIIVGLGGYTNQTTVTTIDSTFVKGKIDTLAVFNHYVQTKGIILNPKAKIKYVEVPVYIDNGETVVLDSLKQFTVKVEDSLITGEGTITNAFNGDLKGFAFKYKPLFPKYLTRVDTVIVHKNTIKTLTNERSLLGLGLGYNNLQYISVLGSYTTKKKLQFIFEYGKSLDNSIELVQGVPFQIQDSDIYSIKVIKNF